MRLTRKERGQQRRALERGRRMVTRKGTWFAALCARSAPDVAKDAKCDPLVVHKHGRRSRWSVYGAVKLWAGGQP